MLEQDTIEMYNLSESLDHSNYYRGHGVALTAHNFSCITLGSWLI